MIVDKNLLTEAFPWVSHLVDGADTEFAVDLARHASKVWHNGKHLEDLLQLITEWEATAEIHADPEAYAALTAPLEPDEFVEVLRPPDLDPYTMFWVAVGNGSDPAAQIALRGIDDGMLDFVLENLEFAVAVAATERDWRKRNETAPAP